MDVEAIDICPAAVEAETAEAMATSTGDQVSDQHVGIAWDRNVNQADQRVSHPTDHQGTTTPGPGDAVQGPESSPRLKYVRSLQPLHAQAGASKYDR